MSKKLKPLTIFLSDDELINFKSHFDEFLNMNCDDKIKEQQQEIERLKSIINEAIEFIYENAYNEERNYQIDDLWDEIPKLLEILNKGE